MALMQEQQVDRDGAEAMISAVRQVLQGDTSRVMMQGDISNANSPNQQVGSADSREEKHSKSCVPLRLTVCEGGNCRCDTRARRKGEE